VVAVCLLLSVLWVLFCSWLFCCGVIWLVLYVLDFVVYRCLSVVVGLICSSSMRLGCCVIVCLSFLFYLVLVGIVGLA